jgi:hydrogenase maturation protease
MRPLIIGLGNDLISDDAVGILTARRLKNELDGQADIMESSISGISLLNLLAGYDTVIIIDAVKTGIYEPGRILEFGMEDLRPLPNPSPHYTGLPEVFELGGRLGITMPDKIRIFAVEAEDITTVGKGLSACVEKSIDDLVRKVKDYLRTQD